jgi:glycosyltransferase involved in cell wall biosynthesis
MVVGGLARSLVNFRGPLLKNFKSRGHEIVACAPDADSKTRKDLSDMGVRYLHVPISRAGLSPVDDFKTLVGLRRIIKQEKPDKILVYTAKPVIYSHLAARFAGDAQVYGMITGLGYAFGNSFCKQRLVGAAARILYRTALKSSSGIFFQNPDDLVLFRKKKILPGNIPVTLINGSGVDLDYYEPQTLPDEPVFLLISRLLADKGIREYYMAARNIKKKYPQARFLLAGYLDSNPMCISKAELEHWQTEGAIEYLGRLDDVRPAIAKSKVYVLPSYREGTPRTVLEAMAMGRPVVTTDAPGCRETVEKDNAGMLELKNSGI